MLSLIGILADLHGIRMGLDSVGTCWQPPAWPPTSGLPIVGWTQLLAAPGPRLIGGNIVDCSNHAVLSNAASFSRCLTVYGVLTGRNPNRLRLS